MNKLFILAVLAFLVVSVALVSAGQGNEATVVGGTIYKLEGGGVVPDAFVNVTCNTYSETTTSLSEGEYSVAFAINECDCDDTVNVYAEKGSLYGSNSGAITMCDLQPRPSLKINVGIVNVPLIPEFGIAVGIMTVLSAVGVFFVIRKK